MSRNSARINVADLVHRTGTTPTTAGKDVDRLERLGILREYTGRQRDRDWLAREIVDVITKETPGVIESP